MPLNDVWGNSWGDSWNGHWAQTSTPATTATLSGTITADTSETDIVAGGKTIILTLGHDTWVSSGASFDAVRQSILNGMTSAGSEATGWNSKVRDVQAVTAVVRTSDTVVTVTLAAAADYDITQAETITVTVPHAALVTSSSAVVASPTFRIAPASSYLTWGREAARRQRVRRQRDDADIRAILRQLLPVLEDAE